MFTTWIVGMGTLPNRAPFDLGMVISGSERGTMNREGVTCMLVADGDAMVRGKVGSFLWAPQAEIEVMSLRSGLSGFNEEIVVRRPVFVLEKLVSEVKRQGMCVKRDGGQGFLFARSGERVKVLRGPNPTPGDGEVL